MKLFAPQNILFVVLVIGAVFVSRTAFDFSDTRADARISDTDIITTSVNAELAAPQSLVVFHPSSPVSSLSQTQNIVIDLDDETEAMKEEPVAEAPALPDGSVIRSAAALGEILGAGEPAIALGTSRRWPIASITKLMAAVVLAENFNLDRRIVMSPTAVGTEGSAGNFSVGEVFTARDLISAMLVVSSNDAAVALASAYGDEFIDRMQEKAWELNMLNTSFVDPTGLSYLNQSTVQDLRLLAHYVFNTHPELLAISATPTAVLRERVSGTTRALTNINYFAGRTGFLGGKTGFIDQSRENLLSFFTRDGQYYLIIVLGSEDRFRQTQEIYDYLTSR